MLKPFAGRLVPGDGCVDQIFPVSGDFGEGTVRPRDPELLHAPAVVYLGKDIIPQHTQGAVIAEEGPLLPHRRLVEVLAVESGGVLPAQIPEERGHQVNLRGQSADFVGSATGEVVDHGGDVVPRNVDLPLACAAGAVVRHDDEDGVGKPGFGPGLSEEFPQSIICVFHSGLPISGRQVYFARREGVRLVVAGGHHKLEEGLAGGGTLVSEFQGLAVDVLITDVPGVLKTHLGIGDAVAVRGDVVGKRIAPVAVHNVKALPARSRNERIWYRKSVVNSTEKWPPKQARQRLFG